MDENILNWFLLLFTYYTHTFSLSTIVIAKTSISFTFCKVLFGTLYYILNCSKNFLSYLHMPNHPTKNLHCLTLDIISQIETMMRNDQDRIQHDRRHRRHFDRMNRHIHIAIHCDIIFLGCHCLVWSRYQKFLWSRLSIDIGPLKIKKKKLFKLLINNRQHLGRYDYSSLNFLHFLHIKHYRAKKVHFHIKNWD